jgi:hypothetical protein
VNCDRSLDWLRFPGCCALLTAVDGSRGAPRLISAHLCLCEQGQHVKQPAAHDTLLRVG